MRGIVQKLDIVLHQTRTIALAMERQDAVTREIAESMTAAANGSINVSSSVERLKTTIEDARGASMKVVTKATDMADEAITLAKDARVRTLAEGIKRAQQKEITQLTAKLKDLGAQPLSS